MLRKTAGDYIAASMDSIMESEDFKKIFRTNEKMIKSAWQDSVDADDMADAKGHTCDATCAEDCAYVKDSHDVKDSHNVKDSHDVKDSHHVKDSHDVKDSHHAKADSMKRSAALNAAVDVLLSVSEYCDQVGLEKTAGLSIYLADILVSEAKAKSSKKSSKTSKDSEKHSGKKMVSKKPMTTSKKKPVKSSEPKPKKKVVKSS